MAFALFAASREILLVGVAGQRDQAHAKPPNAQNVSRNA
jgi:hypothetical protein